MFRPYSLIDEATCLEHAQAVCSQDGKHRMAAGTICLVPYEVGFLYCLGVWHQKRLYIDAREQRLRERVAHVPRHLPSVRFVPASQRGELTSWHKSWSIIPTTSSGVRGRETSYDSSRSSSDWTQPLSILGSMIYPDIRHDI
jgi:hypothetical protein